MCACGRLSSVDVAAFPSLTRALAHIWPAVNHVRKPQTADARSAMYTRVCNRLLRMQALVWCDVMWTTCVLAPNRTHTQINTYTLRWTWRAYWTQVEWIPGRRSTKYSHMVLTLKFANVAHEFAYVQHVTCGRNVFAVNVECEWKAFHPYPYRQQQTSPIDWSIVQWIPNKYSFWSMKSIIQF